MEFMYETQSSDGMVKYSMVRLVWNSYHSLHYTIIRLMRALQ
jgi:hypothetical protein